MKDIEYAMLMRKLRNKYGDVREGVIAEGLDSYSSKFECTMRQYCRTLCEDFDLCVIGGKLCKKEEVLKNAKMEQERKRSV